MNKGKGDLYRCHACEKIHQSTNFANQCCVYLICEAIRTNIRIASGHHIDEGLAHRPQLAPALRPDAILCLVGVVPGAGGVWRIVLAAHNVDNGTADDLDLALAASRWRQRGGGAHNDRLAGQGDDVVGGGSVA